jgi:hypothetical protein
MIKNYFQPAYYQMAKDVTELTDKGLSKGPVIAKGSGHLMIIDKPQLVAVELCEMLQALRGLKAACSTPRL